MVKQIIMDDKLHTLLKIRASRENKTIKKLVAELVKKYLKENKEVIKNNE